MTTLAAALPHPRAELAAPARPRLVLVGGVPGAGKTTLIRRVSPAHSSVRSVDPERLRDRMAARLSPRVPYRWYRPVVHVLSFGYVVWLILRGPTPAHTALVVHDPATRVRRRGLIGHLARRRGWDPTMVFLDVPRAVAVRGQHARGRVVNRGGFDRHWRRWQEQRPALTTAAARRDPSGPWGEVHVVSRDAAAQVLGGLLG
jgi:hypothetical protein